MSDPLSPARGIAIGFISGVIGWLVVGLALANALMAHHGL